MPGSRSTTSPSTTSEPFTVKVIRSVFEPSTTTNVAKYCSVVSPSAAVTKTLKVFSPVTRSVSPETSKVASGSVVSTVTPTSVIPGARSTVEPSSTSSPFTWKVASDVSELGKTTKVTV